MGMLATSIAPGVPSWRTTNKILLRPGERKHSIHTLLPGWTWRGRGCGGDRAREGIRIEALRMLLLQLGQVRSWVSFGTNTFPGSRG
jgi:hypothetical protein